MAAKKKPPSRAKTVRRLARQRVGAAPPSRAILPKPLRKKPKHKKTLTGDAE